MATNPANPLHALLGTVGLEDSFAIKSVLPNFTTTCELQISLAQILDVLGVLLPVFFGKHNNYTEKGHKLTFSKV
ncbi:MAG: hypothetical protein HND44_01625 [Chloroflexi bacterium]|nr:hypothetical protein [Ardenticatenaceae bacterium]NOG33260.1 hypothetical protein [Chloroflexota bacterium]GIK56080.1 MAG: hypothetical protein BroJett015_17430 [Chloroflexota bacterium]